MRKIKKTALSEKIADALNLPYEAVSDIPRVSLNGKGSVRIEAHRGLAEYAPELISVNCGAYIVSIYGAKLNLISMNAYELIIKGEIQRLELG